MNLTEPLMWTSLLRMLRCPPEAGALAGGVAGAGAGAAAFWGGAAPGGGGGRGAAGGGSSPRGFPFVFFCPRVSFYELDYMS